jgi:hypothetical protein
LKSKYGRRREGVVGGIEMMGRMKISERKSRGDVRIGFL